MRNMPSAEPLPANEAELVPRWHVYSNRGGVVIPPEPVKRLPKTVRVSGDGLWAELDGDDGKVERVFVKLRVPKQKRREGVAW